jgi:hypothetical protein
MERPRLRLFPLAQVVLFPRTRLPLHVFEPRYRQLTEDALAADGRIGMVAVPPEHAGALAADPPLYPIGCSGVARDVVRLPGGRFRLVLVGEARFRILDERPRPPERLYRVAEVEPLADPPPEDESRAAALRERVGELLLELLERGGAAAQVPSRALIARLAQLDDGSFTNALSQAVSFATPEKQGLLEAPGVGPRLERLLDLLRFRVIEVTHPAALGSRSIH